MSRKRLVRSMLFSALRSPVADYRFVSFEISSLAADQCDDSVQDRQTDLHFGFRGPSADSTVEVYGRVHEHRRSAAASVGIENRYHTLRGRTYPRQAGRSGGKERGGRER